MVFGNFCARSVGPLLLGVKDSNDLDTGEHNFSNEVYM